MITSEEVTAGRPINNVTSMHRVLNEMSHVDQYGFRYQFSGDEDVALHYLCQQLHLHYGARRAVSQSSITRWQHLLSMNTLPYHLPAINKVYILPSYILFFENLLFQYRVQLVTVHRWFGGVMSLVSRLSVEDSIPSHDTAARLFMT